ncbi:MAG: L,D-transpeptidase family protein, partial [Hyphomicrobiales bacterium]|nr:L,D-transpeptidase family protein [Hyphomicrobiales bacterium]
IDDYQRIVSAGGWAMLPPGLALKLGARGQSVVALRRRLMVTHDLDPSAGLGTIYDSLVVDAVKRFQARHGLDATGELDRYTVAQMNVPAARRLAQLQLNLVRLKTYSGDLGTRFVMVDIPAATVETVENGVVFSHHKAGVGRITRQSPVMKTRALSVNFNPYWTVPASIIKKDLIPLMRKNPNYLADEKIRVFDAKGQEVPANSIDWNSEQATHYRFRQDFGADINALGMVRINIANPYGVYMHDTPEKGIFGDDYRFVSSGCVRVQNVRTYVDWLLKNTPGMTPQAIDDALRSGQRLDVNIADPVNVYWVYITAWAQPGGIVQFRDDIYQRDGLGPVPMARPTPNQDGTTPGQDQQQAQN